MQILNQKKQSANSDSSSSEIIGNNGSFPALKQHLVRNKDFIDNKQNQQWGKMPQFEKVQSFQIQTNEYFILGESGNKKNKAEIEEDNGYPNVLEASNYFIDFTNDKASFLSNQEDSFDTYQNNIIDDISEKFKGIPSIQLENKPIEVDEHGNCIRTDELPQEYIDLNNEIDAPDYKKPVRDLTGWRWFLNAISFSRWKEDFLDKQEDKDNIIVNRAKADTSFALKIVRSTTRLRLLYDLVNNMNELKPDEKNHQIRKKMDILKEVNSNKVLYKEYKNENIKQDIYNIKGFVERLFSFFNQKLKDT